MLTIRDILDTASRKADEEQVTLTLKIGAELDRDIATAAKETGRRKREVIEAFLNEGKGVYKELRSTAPETAGKASHRQRTAA